MPIAAPSAGDRILNTDLGSFYNLLKGVTGSGEAITLVYNGAGVIAFIPSSDPAAGTELFQIKNAASVVQSALSSDGRFYPGDGVVGTPGLAFEQDKDTGLYRIGANQFALVANGTEILRVDVNGISTDGGLSYLSQTINDRVGTWTYDFNGKLGIEATVTGTGAVTTPGAVNTYTTFATGATSGSTAGGRINIGSSNTNGAGKIRLIKLHVQYANIDANTNSWVFMTNESATGQPSNTARHLGLRQAGAVINFSTGDNATEQATDITAAFTQAVDAFVDITFDGTTAKCYVNNVLKATHATNVPSVLASQPVVRVFITNTAASAKNLYVNNFRSVFAV